MGRANEVLVVLFMLFCKDQPADIGRCQSLQAPAPAVVESLSERSRPDHVDRREPRPRNHAE